MRIRRLPKQHYVPQFYIKSFFPGKINQIKCQVEDAPKFSCGVTASNICFERYFYPARTERRLSELEHITREVFVHLCNKGFRSISKKKARAVRQSIMLQHFRTKKMRWSIRIYRQAALALLNYKEISLKAEEMHVDDVEDWVRHASILKRVRFFLINNKTKYEFVFGDAPCILFNQYQPGVVGFASRGLIVYYPLNSNKAILAIDGEHYNIVEGDDGNIDATEDDVSLLNALQFRNCSECVFFGNADEDYIRQLYKNNPSHLSTYANYVVEYHKVTKSLPPNYLVSGVYHQFHVPERFSFFTPHQFDPKKGQAHSDIKKPEFMNENIVRTPARQIIIP